MNGKGDTPRLVDPDLWSMNYDMIFRKRAEEDRENLILKDSSKVFEDRCSLQLPHFHGESL